MMRKHRILPEGQEGGRMGTNCFSGKVKDFFCRTSPRLPFSEQDQPEQE